MLFRSIVTFGKAYFYLIVPLVFSTYKQIFFIFKVIKKLDEERILAQRFLHHSTLPKIENLCYQILVNEQLEKISSMCRDVVQGELLHGIF